MTRRAAGRSTGARSPSSATVMAFVAALALGPGRAAGQQEIVERGNQLYQQEDFAGAIEAYEAVRAGGFHSPDLYYNLGNAYFKAGELGLAILQWERAVERAPGHSDALANLELARSLTTDAVEPLPRFWLFSTVSWWVGLIPEGLLVLIVGGAWVVTAAGAITRILTRREDARRLAGWLSLAGLGVVLLLGTNLVVRELGIGRPERAVILAEAAPVRSAPAEDDDLTLFEVHEGTRVRIDDRAGGWLEVVLDDGKVGWVPSDVVGEI